MSVRAPRKTRLPHGMWSTPRAFVFVAIGAVLWLNNLYQLPFLASEYGGAAFLLVYLFGLAVIGLPLMMAEILIGQHGRLSPPASIGVLAEKASLNKWVWSWLGWLSVLGAFVVFSYYAVIGGWTLAHTVRAAGGMFRGLTIDGVAATFSNFLSDPEKQLFWHSAFVVLTLWVSSQGQAGLEALTRYFLPVLFALLVLFNLYAAGLGGYAAGAARFLAVDFTRLSTEGVLMAISHAFFSLALGMGLFMTYGARVPVEFNVLRMSLYVVAADVVAALLAGLTLFPLLTTGSLDAKPGLAIIFQSLPVAFDQLPLGGLMRTVYFIMALMMVWVSAIALIEPIMLWLVERFKITRARAALWCGLAAWAFGVALILSFSYWSFSFKFFDAHKRFGLFDLALIVTNLFLPLLSAITAVLVGWRLHRLFTPQALHIGSLCVYDVWLWSLRIIAPVLLIIILLNLPKLFL